MQPELGWLGVPPSTAEIGASSIAFSAGPRTDLFTDPAGGEPKTDAPLLLGRPTGDFRLQARASAPVAATFDAAGLVVWASSTAWGKLEVEYSPQGEAMIVSVVTRGVSTTPTDSRSRTRRPGCASRATAKRSHSTRRPTATGGR